jgi:dTDP-4-amino-4,6-dideoxygalactose transaminase
MHVFGHPVEIDKISNLCAKYNVSLIEDCAESLGSFFKEKHTGSFGVLSAISFNGNKTITTGGGGLILAIEESVAKKAKHLTTTAKISHKWEFYHDEIGYNYRMPNLNAALGFAQLEYLGAILENKRKTALMYKEFFADKDCIFIDEPEDSKSNFWLNAIMLNSHQEQQKFLEITNKNSILTRPVWALMTELKHFSHCQTVELKNAKFIREHLVNLPSGFRFNSMGA